MKTKIYKNWVIILLISLAATSCEDFVEIDAPNNKLIQIQVFSNDVTAKSAMTGIYNQLFLAAFSNGSRSSVTLLSGLSADNIRNISTTNLTRMEFEQNEVSPDNQSNLDLWSSAYNMIYMTNSFLEGLENSDQISDETKAQLEGEARFVRSFTYFYLVNLYGDVPLVLSSDYRQNELASRVPKSDIYNQIINDLTTAIALLNSEYENGERTRVNSFAAMALLARVYLYLENWDQAEGLTSQVINSASNYEILENLDEVFLANSKEAIWQISPIGGGGILTHTNEGNLFIIDPVFSFFASLQLRNDFVGEFLEKDKRLINWIGYNSDKEAFYAYKYKIRNSNEFPISEYSMVLRLAEQYLVRAEARAHQANLSGAIQDLDVIRLRGGLDPILEVNPGIDQIGILTEVMQERRKELFAEWGHRWLDLKRASRAGEVLGIGNTLWEATDVLYPIPSNERMKNPNLTQNPGY